MQEQAIIKWSEMLITGEPGVYRYAKEHYINKYNVEKYVPDLFQTLCALGLTKSVRIMISALNYTNVDIHSNVIDLCRANGHQYLYDWLNDYVNIIMGITEAIEEDHHEEQKSIRESFMAPSFIGQHALSPTPAPAPAAPPPPLIDQAYDLLRQSAEEIRVKYDQSLEESVIETLIQEINVYLGAIENQDRRHLWKEGTFPNTIHTEMPKTLSEYRELVRLFVLDERLHPTQITLGGAPLRWYKNLDHVIGVVSTKLYVTYRDLTI